MITVEQEKPERLENYLLDGRLEIDNNWIENKIRPLAIGRKNYLFAGSHNAAERAGMIYSFLAMCRVAEGQFKLAVFVVSNWLLRNVGNEVACSPITNRPNLSSDIRFAEMSNNLFWQRVPLSQRFFET